MITHFLDSVTYWYQRSETEVEVLRETSWEAAYRRR